MAARNLLRCPRMRATLVILTSAICAFGCSEAPAPAVPSPVTPSNVAVQIGTPAGSDGLDFAPLNEGAELGLQTFGQGGTHLLIAARCSGFGSRAFVSASLTNLTTGVVVQEPAPARPQLLFCTDTDVCDLVPYLVHASGITLPSEERNGLHVLLRVRVRNEAGQSAENAREVVLSTAAL